METPPPIHINNSEVSHLGPGLLKLRVMCEKKTTTVQSWKTWRKNVLSETELLVRFCMLTCFNNIQLCFYLKMWNLVQRLCQQMNLVPKKTPLVMATVWADKNVWKKPKEWSSGGIYCSCCETEEEAEDWKEWRGDFGRRPVLRYSALPSSVEFSDLRWNIASALD